MKCFQKVGLVFDFAGPLEWFSSVTLPKLVKLSESELFVLRSIYQLSTNLETAYWQSFEASTLQTSPLSTSFPLPKKVTNGLFDCNPSKVKLYRAMEMLIFWIFKRQCDETYFAIKPSSKIVDFRPKSLGDTLDRWGKVLESIGRDFDDLGTSLEHRFFRHFHVWIQLDKSLLDQPGRDLEILSDLKSKSFHDTF